MREIGILIFFSILFIFLMGHLELVLFLHWNLNYYILFCNLLNKNRTLLAKMLVWHILIGHLPPTLTLVQCGSIKHLSIPVFKHHMNQLPKGGSWHLVLCMSVLHFYSHDNGDFRKHASIWISKWKQISARNKKRSLVSFFFSRKKLLDLSGF